MTALSRRPASHAASSVLPEGAGSNSIVRDILFREGRISIVNSQGVDGNYGVRGNAAGNVLYQKNPVTCVEGSKLHHMPW